MILRQAQDNNDGNKDNKNVMVSREPVERSNHDGLYGVMNSYYVYILLCSDGSYYTGVTNNIKKRFYEHQEGLIASCYTHKRRPVLLVHVEEFPDIIEAISREKQIKGWSRQKKEALITADYETLVAVSKSHPSTSSG